jgi:hypothetical protein
VAWTVRDGDAAQTMTRPGKKSANAGKPGVPQAAVGASRVPAPGRP